MSADADDQLMEQAASAARMKANSEAWYVHYTVNIGNGPQYLTAGPYSLNQVTDEKQDIAGYSGITDAYVSQESKHSKAQEAA